LIITWFGILTVCPQYSFADHDIFLRHFGHGVGHLQYDGEQDIGPDTAVEPEGNNNEDVEVIEEMDDDIDEGAQGGTESNGQPEIDDGRSDSFGESDDSDDNNDDLELDSDDPGYASL
jgi:hypothetical protein